MKPQNNPRFFLIYQGMATAPAHGLPREPSPSVPVMNQHLVALLSHVTNPPRFRCRPVMLLTPDSPSGKSVQSY